MIVVAVLLDEAAQLGEEWRDEDWRPISEVKIQFPNANEEGACDVIIVNTQIIALSSTSTSPILSPIPTL
jgi:hypothetical protein